MQTLIRCVHSAYYELATEYYKESGPPDVYYKHALMLLAYTPLEVATTSLVRSNCSVSCFFVWWQSMGAEKSAALATDMSLAALTGEGVYNFGEVGLLPC